jgi:ubiquinone/menaquinone biosynthesis C-methylase UbiE
MDANFQKRIQRYGWDKAAEYYENSWQQQLLPAQEKLLQAASIKPGEKIIDIACGTGLVTFEAVKKTGTKGFICANDISDKMVEFARSTAIERRIHNVSFERMDAEELKVDDETFDVALCSLGLMYLPDPAKALNEMFRVLKPGGRAVVAVWGKSEHCGWAELFDIVDRRVHSEVCPMFFQLGNDNALEALMEIAGFNNINVEQIKTSLKYINGHDACVAAFRGGPVALAYHKFSPEIKTEVRQEYLTSIEEYKNEDGYAVASEFVVASAIK